MLFLTPTRRKARRQGSVSFTSKSPSRHLHLIKHSDKKRWGGRRQYVRNMQKNTVFRIFLMQKYGLEYLKSGSVCDVAGGKGKQGRIALGKTCIYIYNTFVSISGALSWELTNLSGVKDCVVIDPRPLNLTLEQSKWAKGMFEPKRFGPVFSKWYPACFEGCKDTAPTGPKHIRSFFDSSSFADFVSAHDDSAVARTNAIFESELKRAGQTKWTTKGLQHEDGTSFTENEDVDESEPITPCGSTQSTEITDPCEARALLDNCKIVVGLHPDQAAGHIVDFATARGIPWCVVPCCVYFDFQNFSQRKLKSGKSVRSYDDLCQWLLEKDPRAKMETLELEGKNKVIYTLPR